MDKVKFENLLRQKIMPVILGATASGKTATSLELAKMADIEIISADSRQIYKHLTIGTAKPPQNELEAVPHHYIDIIEPDSYFSAGLFGELASETAEQIFKRGKIPVVAGGSGLYIQALCEGLFDEKKSDYSDIRNQLSRRLNIDGTEKLYSELYDIDSVSAEKYSDRNPRRIIRALEYYYVHGRPFSEAQIEQRSRKTFNCRYYAIDYPRQELYNRINIRAEIMWNPKDDSTGIIDETKKVLAMGFSPELNALNTVGYKECIAFLKGTLSGEQALDKMKQNTRRYAKRQLTWFRRYSDIMWLKGSPLETAQAIFDDLTKLSLDEM